MLDLIIAVGICFGLPVILALLLSGNWKAPKNWLWGFAATVAVFLNLVVVGFAQSIIPSPPFMAGLEWNWIGKTATIAATLMIFAALPKTIRVEAGIMALPKTDNWRQVFLVCLALLIFFWSVAYMLRDGDQPTAEYFMFQAVMPSIDEEFAYRGTILAMLVAAFGKPYQMLGIRTGWAALPVIMIFGLFHGYDSYSNGSDIDHLSIASTIFVTGVAGAGLYWLKEKTASVWICVLMHSLMNMGSGFFGSFPT